MKEYQGLTDVQAVESAKKEGRNTISMQKKNSFWKIYWGKFDDPIILILLIALGINVIFTFFGKVDWHECAGILLSVLISTFVSTLSEYNNENTFQILQEEADQILCKVYRNQRLTELPIGELVVGDKVLLESGDKVPADGQILSGSIQVDQSPLNGESKEVLKKATQAWPEKSNLVDFWNRHSLYRGSVVCGGECTMRIDAVGDRTVFGKMAQDAQTELPESPLTVKLRGLATSISRFGYISAVFLILISFFQKAVLDQNFQLQAILAYLRDYAQVSADLVSALIIGIIVVVVAVPEGLPLMIAIVCSINMKKMLKSKVLVRKLIGIETAGSINLLFSDKTGTITKGRLEVISWVSGDAKEYAGFSELPDGLRKKIGCCICATSAARFSDQKIVGGNATEKALLRAITRGEAFLDGAKISQKIPFSSERKFSAAQTEGKETVAWVKGAPELLLAHCKKYIDADGKIQPFTYQKQIENQIQALAENAVRVIALAAATTPLTEEDLPNEMIFLGFVSIRDEVRPTARAAIGELERAGVQVVMITGDRKETAVAIAKEAGLYREADEAVLTSQEMAQMSDQALQKVLPALRVVARALPTDKSRLVRIAQEMNLVVGMTGDGVNDAPALKQADVGFSMGSGAEVAKEAGDIVIMDDNFSSIRQAVLYGRTIYHSIKRFIQFQLTINVAAVAISVLGPIVGVEKPLNISQMIWTNLMIDSLAAIAFGGEPALKRFLLEKPKSRDERILDAPMWNAVIWNGLYISALSLVFFISPSIRSMFRYAPDDIYFYTGYFTFFIMICICNAFNARTDSPDLLENLALNKQFLAVMAGIGTAQVLMTYYGGALLRTAGLCPSEWILVMALALTIIPMDLLRKIWFSLRHPRRG